jgi:CelD/BcsL family acetyltransferase involved in cellulose biosynthesis
VKISVLEKIPEEPEITLAWNNLVYRMERPEVFFTHQWALAASRAFSKSLSPLTFLAYESGQLVGVAALATESPGIVSFLTASTADYCDFVSEPELRAPLLVAVLEELDKRSLRNLVLANVPSESHTLRVIESVSKSRHLHLHQRPAYECGIISLADEGQRQAVLRSLVRKEREKRGLRKLGQLGSIRVSHLAGEQAEIALQSIFAAQVSRFLATDRLSPLIRQPRRTFLTELGRLLSPVRWLKVSQLEVNGNPIAWNYGFRFADSWFWYLPTFLIQYADRSPGSCLLRLLAEEACADAAVKRLDLGLGDEAYKERFSNAISSTQYVELSSKTSRHLGTVGRNWLALSVGRFPALGKQLRRGRDSIRNLQDRTGDIGLAATAMHAVTRATKGVMSRDEVAFFEAPQMNIQENEGTMLIPLTWEHIALAAMNCEGDDQTLKYLVRCAQRLKRGDKNGYCLEEPREVTTSHFLWFHAYNGFHLAEIDSTLESSDPNAAMIYDCWTPLSYRGRGKYAKAIRLLAAQLGKQRQVWIFSAAKNEPSIRGILKAGFIHRFSIVRSRMLGYSTLTRREVRSVPAEYQQMK